MLLNDHHIHLYKTGYNSQLVKTFSICSQPRKWQYSSGRLLPGEDELLELASASSRGIELIVAR